MISKPISAFEKKIKKFIPNRIKFLIVKLLANKFFGQAIKIMMLRRTIRGGTFDYQNVSNKEAAEIFFGFWEAAEIRFALRFAKSKTIIELGSSVGEMLGTLANKRYNTKFICVEASPINFDKLLKLKQLLPHNSNEYRLINKAIAYGLSHVPFLHRTTKGSKVLEKKINDSIQLSCITLSEIIKKFKIEDDYCLITDIEGNEAPIFFEDSKALGKCVNIIAEIEDTQNVSANRQINQLKKIGFSLIEQHGRVYVFSKV